MWIHSNSSCGFIKLRHVDSFKFVKWIHSNSSCGFIKIRHVDSLNFVMWIHSNSSCGSIQIRHVDSLNLNWIGQDKTDNISDFYLGLSQFSFRSTRYSDRSHDFSVTTIPRCYKNVYVNSFFHPRTAGLWNSVPVESFPLSYDLNGFKSGINRHLLTEGSFWTDFLYALIFLCFFFM